MVNTEYPLYPVPAVSGVIIDEKRRVLLVKRKYPPAQGKWSFPGGSVDLGEELDEAVQREVFEETGLRIKTGMLLTHLTRIYCDKDEKVKYHYILLDFLCEIIGGKLKAGTDAEEVRWIPINELKNYDTTEGLGEVVKKGMFFINQLIYGPQNL